MDVRTTLKVLRSGDMRARLPAIRDGRAAIRLSLTAAALDTGVLAALAEGPSTTQEVANRTGATDVRLLEAFLRVLVAYGLAKGDGRWSLARRGRSVLGDDVARATYIAFSDYHTGLYRHLDEQLRGGPGRDDVTRQAETIARLSRVMEPFVIDLVRSEVAARPTQRVLDVGCGSGSLLAAMLEGAPEVTGVGVELDPVAADLARHNLEERGLAGRSRVLTGDVRALMHEVDGVDLALLANFVYYLPNSERVGLFRQLADELVPGGALVVVSTAATDDMFSRHFDLLLRAQEGEMELPDMDELAAQLTEAGLRPGTPRRVAYGEPLMALVAERP